MLYQGNLEQFPSEAESRMVVRFQDCDPLQHLNNAKYFDYFFNAREDQLSKIYGFTYSSLFREYKTSWVVYQHQIAYVRPAVISEWVRITSRIIHHDSDTIITESYMTNDSRTELKTLLWTTSKHVSILDGKRTPHPPELTTFLDAILHHGSHPDHVDFNHRVKHIKEELANKSNQ